MVIYSNSALSR